MNDGPLERSLQDDGNIADDLDLELLNRPLVDHIVGQGREPRGPRDDHRRRKNEAERIVVVQYLVCRGPVASLDCLLELRSALFEL